MNFRKAFGFLIICAAGCFIFATRASAQTGLVFGSPNPCVIPGGQTVCTTTISWSSSGTSQVQVWVSLNGGAESNFATCGSGGPYSQSANWIVGPPNSLVFALYDYSNGSRGVRLATTTVTGQYGISLTFQNNTRPDLGSNFVDGDYYKLTESGGPPSGQIIVQWTNVATGAVAGPYLVATTDSQGNYNGAPVLVSAGGEGDGRVNGR